MEKKILKERKKEACVTDLPKIIYVSRRPCIENIHKVVKHTFLKRKNKYEFKPCKNCHVFSYQ